MINLAEGVKANRLEISSHVQRMVIMSQEKITKPISETKVESRAIAEIMTIHQITHIKHKVIKTMETITHQVEAMAAVVEALGT